MGLTIPSPVARPTIHDFWAMWIGRGCFEWEHQGYPFIGTMHHVQSWWDYRHLDNLLLLHYADMLADPAGEIGRLADFLEIEISDEALAQVVEDTSLRAMRQRAMAAEAVSERKDKTKIGGGAKTFFNKGTNKRWQGVLTEAELAMYEQVKARLLTPDCVRWLELGRAAYYHCLGRVDISGYVTHA